MQLLLVFVAGTKWEGPLKVNDLQSLLIDRATSGPCRVSKSRGTRLPLSCVETEIPQVQLCLEVEVPQIQCSVVVTEVQSINRSNCCKSCNGVLWVVHPPTLDNK